MLAFAGISHTTDGILQRLITVNYCNFTAFYSNRQHLYVKKHQYLPAFYGIFI